MDANYVTKKAVSLIKQIHNPPIGATEFSGGWCRERCDAILFNSCESFMIETKVTRSDFLSDANKPFRCSKNERLGVGVYRYYACPEGLIGVDELPPKWGLIYVKGKNQRASMPVGFGGYITDPKKREKHPDYDFMRPVSYFFGSKDTENYKFEINLELERRYLFALATRYKTRKFMQNIL
jgi:hypothetical protein